MSQTADIRFITAEATLPLRSRVLREGRPLDQCRFAEDGQPGSFHIGDFGTCPTSNPLSGPHLGAAGVASYYPKGLEGHTGRGFQLRGMAVAPESQRGGVGRKLLCFAERHIRTENLADYLWCNARVSAIAFYERDGWAVVSEEFEIPEVGPHRRMVKRL